MTCIKSRILHILKVRLELPWMPVYLHDPTGSCVWMFLLCSLSYSAWAAKPTHIHLSLFPNPVLSFLYSFASMLFPDHPATPIATCQNPDEALLPKPVILKYALQWIHLSSFSKTATRDITTQRLGFRSTEDLGLTEVIFLSLPVIRKSVQLT